MFWNGGNLKQGGNASLPLGGWTPLEVSRQSFTWYSVYVLLWSIGSIGAVKRTVPSRPSSDKTKSRPPTNRALWFGLHFQLLQRNHTVWFGWHTGRLVRANGTESTRSILVLSNYWVGKDLEKAFTHTHTIIIFVFQISGCRTAPWFTMCALSPP